MPKFLQSHYSNITRTGDVRTITILNPKILYPLALYCKYSPPWLVTLLSGPAVSTDSTPPL